MTAETDLLDRQPIMRDLPEQEPDAEAFDWRGEHFISARVARSGGLGFTLRTGRPVQNGDGA